MFQFLGKTVTRFWPLWLGAWILLLGLTWRLAPPWDEVTQGGDVVFLPDDTPSRRGEQLFKQAFPDEYFDSSVVLILSREEDSIGLKEQDKKFISQFLTPALKKLADKGTSPGQETGSDAGTPKPETNRPANREHTEPVIARIRSPEEEGVGTLL